ncbi:MAG TPA: rod shape-determining protein MreD [Soehngenia sp.]|nr:rod shape-determining protein MreD [Soehngenia sp.]HPP31313.1 rod shape-determining protein MreD [Soehngenia sp.]
MNILILLAAAIINLILQSTVFPSIEIFGVVPNTALVLIIVISLFKGRFVGSIYGVFVGLLTDILYSSVIGINSLILFFVGYFIGFAKDSFARDNLLTPVIFTVLSTIFFNAIYALVVYFLTADISLKLTLQNIFSFEIVYNAIFSIIYYKIFSKIFTRPKIKFN